MGTADALVCWLAILLAWCSPLPAAEEPIITPTPIIAPADEWVAASVIPDSDPDPAYKDASIQMLMTSSQTKHEQQGYEHYFEFAIALQSPESLILLGNINLPWKPSQYDLIIHKVHIIRNGQVIDVLASGQKFTVLRRESGLESAVLDGMLTATLQPEGLVPGDVLNVAYSLRSKSGSLPFKSEFLSLLTQYVRVRHL